MNTEGQKERKRALPLMICGGAMLALALALGGTSLRLAMRAAHTVDLLEGSVQKLTSQWTNLNSRVRAIETAEQKKMEK